MFNLECRLVYANGAGEWFQFSVPTEDGAKAAEYLKAITEKSKPSEVCHDQFVPKQFRLVYTPTVK